MNDTKLNPAPPAARTAGSQQQEVRPTEAITYFQDSEIGMTMEAEKVKQLPDGSWLATAEIGTIFGAEVEGQLSGTGPTKEVALAALKQARKDLNDSLWA